VLHTYEQVRNAYTGVVKMLRMSWGDNPAALREALDTLYHHQMGRSSKTPYRSTWQTGVHHMYFRTAVREAHCMALRKMPLSALGGAAVWLPHQPRCVRIGPRTKKYNKARVLDIESVALGPVDAQIRLSIYKGDNPDGQPQIHTPNAVRQDIRWLRFETGWVTFYGVQYDDPEEYENPRDVQPEDPFEEEPEEENPEDAEEDTYGVGT